MVGPSRLGKLVGLSGVAYERVDGGEAGVDVEMPGLDSDDDLEVGSASGWATPKMRGEGAADVVSPGKRFVDGLARTDSRDALSITRLDGLLNRPRSPATRFLRGKGD